MAPKADIKQEKKDYIQNLAKTFKEAGSVTFVDYTGMDVAMQQELKAKLKESQSRMFVAKNTLIRLAGKVGDIPNEAMSEQILSGQTAVIISGEDAVSPIQVLGGFIKDSQVFKFKAGVVEGSFQNQEALNAISKLPGKAELFTNAVGALSVPMYGLVATLQGNLQKLVFILNAHAKSLSAN